MTVEPPSGGRRRAALIFILLTVTFDTLALGIIIPVFPRLVIDFVGGDIRYAATMVGTARRKENSTIDRLLMPISEPPMMVAAARETPGTTAMA